MKDFQILCIAHYLKERFDIDDANFESFFIRLEQVMAYTRYERDKEEGFNGIDKVRRVYENSNKELKVSSSLSDQILSNQKAYGIWGKYTRPFSDMHFTSDSSFIEVFESKIERNNEFIKQVSKLKKKEKDQTSVISKGKLRFFYDLLEKPEQTEKELFTTKLLDDTCNKELFQMFASNKELLNLSFYDLLQALSSRTNNDKLQYALQLIYNTEKVLSPLNRVFRYLQTQSFWKQEEIEKNSFIDSCRIEVDTTLLDDTPKQLASLLKNDSNWELVVGLTRRNEEVSLKRGSAPWIQQNAAGIEVNHFEGASFSRNYDPTLHNDNYYFLNTYVSLFKQLDN
ncbi:hypothetical protein ACFSRY_10090 [Pontibacter locisalis]|uniref:Uncharacterized protein n=1 Tax=Pontibacter locisalis TaxID=1719035 RepID=A0ABW5IMQ2_9BACT